MSRQVDERVVVRAEKCLLCLYIPAKDGEKAGQEKVDARGTIEDGITWRYTGCGKASFYRGRHLPADRHYRAK